MTNAEKLAKDIDYMTAIIWNYTGGCEECPADKSCNKNDIVHCSITIRRWLESEVSEK